MLPASASHALQYTEQERGHIFFQPVEVKMSGQILQVFNAEQTAELLPFPRLVETLQGAVVEYARGNILSPERQALPFQSGGVMLSMPATGTDIAIHKLVNVVPANRASGLPTIHGIVAVYDGNTGQPLCLLDGPTVTARRTAAVSLLGIKAFLKSTPRRIALIGAGKQSSGHAGAIASLYPRAHVTVVAPSTEKGRQFVDAHRTLDLKLEAADSVPADADVVITLTTSKTPVYREAARKDRLVIGVGAFQADAAEISAQTIHDSQLFVDDLHGAHSEAGDLIQAGVDWANVNTLADALLTNIEFQQPVVFKSVGCAAWDLAAGRCALESLRVLQSA